MKKAAFIGTGNMGAPLIQAACRAVGAEQVVIANRTRAKAEALAAELGCAVAQDNRAAAAQAITALETTLIIYFNVQKTKSDSVHRTDF